MEQTQLKALWRVAFRESWPVSVCRFAVRCLSLVTVAQLRQYGQRWPLWSPLCVSSLEYVGRLQKAVRGFCVAPRKEAHGGPVASGSGFPGIVRRGSDLCNTWKGKAPVGVVGMCCVFPSCVLASAPINKHSEAGQLRQVVAASHSVKGFSPCGHGFREFSRMQNEFLKVQPLRIWFRLLALFSSDLARFQRDRTGDRAFNGSVLAVWASCAPL
jgi:hypothetical protein